MKENTANKLAIQDAIETGNPAAIENALMQDAIESGELTKAFASAWANKNVGDQNGSASAINNEPETKQYPSTSKYLSGVHSYTKKGKGVSIKGAGQ